MTAEFVVAVHAAVFLYHNDAEKSSQEIARNVCTNPARVRKIMAKLEKAGIVTARSGNGGGYALATGGGTTLREILRAVGDRAVSAWWRSGSLDMDCQIASGMAAVLDGVRDELETACEAELETITLREMNDRLTAERNKNEAL